MRHYQKRFLTIFITLAILLVVWLIYFFISYQHPREIIGGLVSPAKAAAAEEYIEDFQVNIQINNDNSVEVREKIIYNFGDQERHGIYREIPYKYQARGGNFTVGVKVLSVTDENNQSYHYELEKIHGNLKIKIGDLQHYLSGFQTFIINYQMNRVINYFAEHDEFYWNVTGNRWLIPIDRAGVVIKLPAGTKAEDLQAKCFTGEFGSSQENCQITNIANSQVGYAAFQTLAPGEGLTVVLGWPKGILQPPTMLTQLVWILKDNPLMLLPLICFLVMLFLWYFHGRDLGKKQAIIPQYQPPAQLLPAEVGSLIDERVNLVDISSILIDLAVRGYLKIKQINQRDWELVKLKDFDSLKQWEREFIEQIFTTPSTNLWCSGKQATIKISELKNKFYKNLPALTKKLYQELVNKKYFPTSPAKVRLLYLIVAVILLFIGIIILPFFGGGLNILFLVVSSVIIFWLGQSMPYKTKAGTLAWQEIKGYKMYLSVAEKERLKFHNAPAKNPQEFEKHLPYAMVLKVEKQWAKQFKDIYLNQPSWYEGKFSTFNTLVFINSLNSLNYGAKAIFASRPSGAAGGRSGFSSGGGFAGGGFGGGGGGSW